LPVFDPEVSVLAGDAGIEVERITDRVRLADLQKSISTGKITKGGGYNGGLQKAGILFCSI
jgi:hypothetical protein